MLPHVHFVANDYALLGGQSAALYLKNQAFGWDICPYVFFSRSACSTKASFPTRVMLFCGRLRFELGPLAQLTLLAATPCSVSRLTPTVLQCPTGEAVGGAAPFVACSTKGSFPTRVILALLTVGLRRSDGST